VLHGLAVCAGFGGLELGLRLVFGDAYRTVCFVEREAFAAASLVALMRAGLLDEAPVWDDMVTFDGRAWRGHVDLVSGGLPCQPYSVAGQQRGDADERAIWPRFIRVVREIRPALVLIENVPPFLAWYRPIGDRLSRLGYEYQVGLFRASEVGAPHRRERLFILAHTSHDGCRRSRERNGSQNEQWDGAPWHDADGCHPNVAYSCRPRRPEVPAGASCDEGSHEGWAATHGDEPPGRGTPMAAPCDRQLPFARWREEERTWAGSTGAAVGHTVDGIPERGSLLRSATVQPSPDAVGHTASDRWGEGRPAPAVGRRRTTVAVTGGDVGDANRTRLEERSCGAEPSALPSAWPPSPAEPDRWRALLAVRPDLAPAIERRVLRVADGMADRVDRLRGVGNGVVPLAAAPAFCTLAAAAGLDIQQLEQLRN
jgi:DNA (cytosine-5)-methyltransferase 1